MRHLLIVAMALFALATAFDIFGLLGVLVVVLVCVAGLWGINRSPSGSRRDAGPVGAPVRGRRSGR
jgi:hypothetical protein